MRWDEVGWRGMTELQIAFRREAYLAESVAEDGARELRAQRGWATLEQLHLVEGGRAVEVVPATLEGSRDGE
jgi:hypothetical protein